MRAMLTTTDNPFNPFVQFEAWRAFDDARGYHTCEYLARIVKDSDALSPVEHEAEVTSAIDEIVKLNVFGIYKKVFAE